MYNTIITDLDGTLLNKEHEISDTTIELLNNLNSKGIKIILATGRNYNDATRVRKKLNFKPAIITSNGAELTDKNDNLVYKVLLEKEIVEEIIKINYKKYGDIYINFIENDKWSGIEKYPDTHKILEWQSENWKFTQKTIDKIEIEKTLKIFFIGEHNNLLNLLDEIKFKLKDKINYAFTLPFCLEIFPQNINKANALKKLSLIDKIDFDKAIAFGDGYNDVEMLKLVPKSFLMGNAQDSLKELLKDIEVIGTNENESMQNKVKEIFGVNR